LLPFRIFEHPKIRASGEPRADELGVAAAGEHRVTLLALAQDFEMHSGPGDVDHNEVVRTQHAEERRSVVAAPFRKGRPTARARTSPYPSANRDLTKPPRYPRHPEAAAPV
jgi:hypothetical protein